MAQTWSIDFSLVGWVEARHEVHLFKPSGATLR